MILFDMGPEEPMKHNSDPPESASFDDTTGKLEAVNELFDDFDAKGIKYSKVKKLLAKDLAAVQSSLERRIGDMEKRFGINFNDKVWIDSVDTLMANAVGEFYFGLKNVQNQSELDLIIGLEQHQFSKSLKDLGKSVAELLAVTMKQQQKPNYLKQLTAQEIQDFLLQTHRVLYEPLDYLDAIVATPEKEMQYAAYLAENTFHSPFPSEFKQLLEGVISPDDLQRNLPNLEDTIYSLHRLLKEKRKSRAPLDVDQKKQDRVESIFVDLEALLRDPAYLQGATKGTITA